MASSANAKVVGLASIAKFHRLARPQIALDMEQLLTRTVWMAVSAVAKEDGLAANVSNRPPAVPEKIAVAMASPLATNSRMVAVALAILVIPGLTAARPLLAMLQWTAVVTGLPMTWTRPTVVCANVQVGFLEQTVLFHHLVLRMMIAMDMGRQATLTRQMDVIAHATKAGQVTIVTRLQRARQASTVQATAALRTWTAQMAAHASAKVAGVDLPARFLHLAGKLLSAMGMVRPRMQTD